MKANSDQLSAKGFSVYFAPPGTVFAVFYCDSGTCFFLGYCRICTVIEGMIACHDFFRRRSTADLTGSWAESRPFVPESRGRHYINVVPEQPWMLRGPEGEVEL